ncbi:nucleotide exchange factor GrpE [candidate division WOR-1 bacterium RIFOXYB2_FULL_48_7]|uniref:Protein GrpE n=1 Tax=candidate division WOR-1 bacterium RIFOXYB2_FULL_48_7 TaxID=1802583 RepID=A0A1F4TRN0_UNCSA|nr:MAG: nucleotide exchange factor GrpE [candidate division WOR-1 bacterium RIFOXYB2_FULL_48_7]
MSEELETIQPELPPEKSELELLAEELEATKQKYLRALADFDNYKKRSNLERDQFVQFANENLIKELLPIMDNFARALPTVKDEDVLKGLSLISKQLGDALGKFGLREIPAVNQPYDPNFHEAILQKESAGPEGINLEELQKGYSLHSRVIRPSMVIVSKKGAK